MRFLSKEERATKRAEATAKYHTTVAAAYAKRDARMDRQHAKVDAKATELTDKRIEAQNATWAEFAEKSEALVLEAAAAPSKSESKKLAKRAAKYAKWARAAHEKAERIADERTDR